MQVLTIDPHVSHKIWVYQKRNYGSTHKNWSNQKVQILKICKDLLKYVMYVTATKKLDIKNFMLHGWWWPYFVHIIHLEIYLPIVTPIINYLQAHLQIYCNICFNNLRKVFMTHKGLETKLCWKVEKFHIVKV